MHSLSRLVNPPGILIVVAIVASSTILATQSPAQDYRLPTDVIPVQQSVSLQLDPDQSDYTGSTTIQVEVKTATQTFEFHAEEMELTKVTLRKDGVIMSLKHEPGKDNRVVVTAPKILEPGTYVLEIDFKNAFGTKAVGLYKMEQDGKGWVFTQFEADDAREAFPCWDEPSYKIPWQMSIQIPEGMTAVTNTNIERTSTDGDWRYLDFKQTKPLPTYLLVIAAGRLESIPMPGMSIPGSIVTVEGQSHLAALAAKMTPPILAALEEFFDARYPYEKLDFIAIPEYWPGAMEHPGAVTYADNILLVDEASASVAQKRRIARIVAHELAHMWFGDFVTMEWWDDLWLNESFADWMGDKITVRVYPEFDLELSELRSSLGVMNGDSRPSAEAIRQVVTSTDNLLQNVGVQYNKGKAVLSMIETWMGPEKFRQGVNNYLQANAWGNARSDDFWAALSAEGGAEVTATLKTFIEQPGVPLVSMEILSNNAVRVTQKRFSNFGVTDQEPLTWQIPVSFRVGMETEEGVTVVEESFLLTQESETVSLDLAHSASWIVPNAGQHGYYRYQMETDALLKLAQLGPKAMDSRERMGFLSNASALLDAGVIGGDEYLAILTEFASDPEPMVVSMLIDQIGKVEVSFISDEMRTQFGQYVRQTLGPAKERFGVEPQPGESEAVAIFRPRLLLWLGDTGQDMELRAKATEMANMYMADPTSIDPSLVNVALRLAALDGDQSLFDEYKKHFETTQTPTERRSYLQALGNFRDPALMDQALEYILEGPLRPQEIFSVTGQITGYPPNRDRVFEWFASNYEAIESKVPPIFMGFMPRLAGGCSSERLARAEEFFGDPAHQVSGTAPELAKVSDQITDCVSLRDREEAKVSSYLGQLVGAN